MASNSFNPLLGCLGLSVPILAGGKVSTWGHFNGLFLYLRQPTQTGIKL